MVAYVDRVSIEIRSRKEQWELKKIDFELGAAQDCRQIDSNRSLLSDFIVEEPVAGAAQEDHKYPENAPFAGWRRDDTDLQ